MSGDVQPRKRRDKKKKKDEGEETAAASSQYARAPSLTPLENDDVNIHVHKESSTGGGICAKFVFFILLSALAVLIGLIITEHRGLTDLDTIEKENRFSQIFEGWVDTTPDDHDDHGHGAIEEHEDEHDEHDDHDDHDDEHDDHDEEEVEEHDDHDEEVDDHEEEEEEEEEIEESVQEDDQEATEEEDDDQEVSEEQEDEEDEEEQSVQEDDEDEDEDEEAVSEQNDDDVSEVAKSEEEDDDDDNVNDDEADDEVDEEEEEEEEQQASEQAASEQEEDEVDDNDDDEDDVPDIKSEEKNEDEADEDDKDVPEVGDDPEQEAEDDDDAEAADGDGDGEEQPIGDSKPSGGQQVDDIEENKDWLHTAESYDFETINNEEDLLIVDQLDEAQENINNNAALALSQFNRILNKTPKSPRALYGKAQALDNLAELKKSNDLLTESITNYLAVIHLDAVPNALFISAADRCINRLRFIGQYGRAINVHKLLIDKFPHDIKYRNQLAVTYLTVNRISEARLVLQEALTRWPSDGFSLVHYGFILKVNDNDLINAIDYLRRGIATRQNGVVDGRFYFHLGDALTRLGRHQEAKAVYKDGVANKVFFSEYQRSLYNVDRLSGKPWWSRHRMPAHYQQFFNLLESKYEQIRDEGVAILNERGFFQDEAENLRDSGEWKQFELFARGQKHKKNCLKCPLTCGIVETFSEAVSCRRGQVKFSVMHPGTHVWPHCGPTNCRLRVHLGLQVPSKTFIRVADETRSWKEGNILIFDDSFEHEVWHNGTKFRLVLIVDVWHPELTPNEKRSLSAI